MENKIIIAKIEADTKALKEKNQLLLKLLYGINKILLERNMDYSSLCQYNHCIAVGINAMKTDSYVYVEEIQDKMKGEDFLLFIYQNLKEV